MTVHPFPLNKTRPGLVSTLRFAATEARLDTTRGLWAPKPDDNPDHLTPDLLLEGMPQSLDAHSFHSLACYAKDFSLLGLLAVHTGQWMRPDMLEHLMKLQAIAERYAPTRITKP